MKILGKCLLATVFCSVMLSRGVCSTTTDTFSAPDVLPDSHPGAPISLGAERALTLSYRFSSDGLCQLFSIDGASNVRGFPSAFPGFGTGSAYVYIMLLNGNLEPATREGHRLFITSFEQYMLSVLHPVRTLGFFREQIPGVPGLFRQTATCVFLQTVYRGSWPFAQYPYPPLPSEPRATGSYLDWSRCHASMDDGEEANAGTTVERARVSSDVIRLFEDSQGPL
jgi:hypothetical protein